ncbi:MAG: DNA integrity scanning diadenylate cyclase DisA [Sulfobacillus sp.]
MSRGNEGEILDMVRMVAPGTPLREGLDNILHAHGGALIVLDEGPEVGAIFDSGFPLDIPFAPASLYELSKMDGAIVLSADLKRIRKANVHLVPDSSILSTETGIRHRTAERAAKATGALLIAISQRRSVISLYRGPVKHVLEEPGLLMGKANQALATTIRYRHTFNDMARRLTLLEFEEDVSVQDVTLVLQQAAILLSVKSEIDRYVAELGSEGRLIGIQLHELIGGVQEEALLVLRDYAEPALSRELANERLAELAGRDSDDILNTEWLSRFLHLGPDPDRPLVSRGMRILSRLPRLPDGVISHLIDHFGSFSRIQAANLEQLDQVEGVGEARARSIQSGLSRLHEDVLAGTERI